eukprot:scaffold236_cov419-Prasinococcus_capsulatus_cf.AAC.6
MSAKPGLVHNGKATDTYNNRAKAPRSAASKRSASPRVAAGALGPELACLLFLPPWPCFPQSYSLHACQAESNLGRSPCCVLLHIYTATGYVTRAMSPELTGPPSLQADGHLADRQRGPEAFR